MRIRRSTAADVPRALEIWRAAVDSTHGFLSAEDREEIDNIVAEQFLPAVEMWLAIDGQEEVVGFLVMDGNKIDALFVDPERHGQGFGTLLLNHALEPNAIVDVNEQATNALPFYLARGFRTVGRSPTDEQGRPYPLLHLAR